MITPNGELLALRVINFGMRTRITYAHVVLGPLPDWITHVFPGYLFDAAYRPVACLLHVAGIIHRHLILYCPLSLPRLRHHVDTLCLRVQGSGFFVW